MSKDDSVLLTKLRSRTKRTLPRDWRKGLLCPECGTGADRPKCMWDMGGSCPRHDPDNYEPSPYVTVPDPDCAEAADRINALTEREAALDDDALALLRETSPLGSYFRKVAAMLPDEHPKSPDNPIRPFSTGDVKYLATLFDRIDAYLAKEPRT